MLTTSKPVNSEPNLQSLSPFKLSRSEQNSPLLHTRVLSAPHHQGGDLSGLHPHSPPPQRPLTLQPLPTYSFSTGPCYFLPGSQQYLSYRLPRQPFLPTTSRNSLSEAQGDDWSSLALKPSGAHDVLPEIKSNSRLWLAGPRKIWPLPAALATFCSSPHRLLPFRSPRA